MKKIKIATIISFISMMLMITACKKEEAIVSIPVFDGDSRDIRVLKVEFYGEGFEAYTKQERRLVTYHYNDAEKTLKQIDINALIDGLSFVKSPYISVAYNEKSTKFYNEIIKEEPWKEGLWQNTTVHTRSDRFGVDSISVETESNTSWAVHYTVFEGVVSIMREEGFVSNLYMKSEGEIPAYSTYYPLQTQILSYNSFKMPENTRSVKDKKMPVNDLLEFDFEYVKAADIPMKLKRLVNEELLYLNRYGVTNYDLLTLTENTSLYTLLSGKEFKSGWGSIYGEGNWLVSFGLPQYHILEDKSTHIVSKRTTKHYKINDAGEREYIKTTVEDFPYVHDASAKTLEIAGLKIWYEFVDER